MKSYRAFLFMLCLLCNGVITFGQSSETQIVLDSIMAHAETYSLYRNKVDWSQLRKEVYAKAKDADSVSKLKPALDLLLEKLNDTHGRVFHNQQYLAYYVGEKQAHLQGIDWDVYGAMQSGAYEFKAELLADHIGYIRIVGMPMGDNEKMATEIQDAVCAVLKEGAEKWIVDLRYNGGGNMFPMVEGIAPLIGDGIVGGTQGASEEDASVWRIEKGDFYYDWQTVAIPNTCAFSEESKIAVLTSMYTISSGEALAVILKGRPNTKFFGESTNGKVTATDWKPIDAATAMSISVGFYQDRNGKVYEQFVDVDEYVRFTPDAPLDNDQGIQAATKWLNE